MTKATQHTRTHAVCMCQHQSPSLAFLPSPDSHKSVFYIYNSISVLWESSCKAAGTNRPKAGKTHYATLRGLNCILSSNQGLKEIGIPGHLTCLLRNLYAGQEATVRTGHGPTGWFQIGKGVCQGCILSPCLFNLYAEYIMRNAGLEEAQAGIKIAGRNINNLRYADDTTLMAESEEELKSL